MAHFFHKLKKSHSKDSEEPEPNAPTAAAASSSSTDSTSKRASHLSKEAYWDPHHSQIHHKWHTEDQEVSEDPVDFVKEALAPIFTFSKKKGMDAATLRAHHLPRYFAENYVHRVNGTLLTQETEGGPLRIIELLRNRYVECKIRFKTDVVDTSDLLSLEAASVGLTYEVVAEQKYPDGFVDEKRFTVVSIFRIEQGKMVSCDLVTDTSAFQDSDQKNLDCTIS